MHAVMFCTVTENKQEKVRVIDMIEAAEVRPIELELILLCQFISEHCTVTQ
jgi:hypothetical protein